MFLLQLRNELWKLFGKKRTYIGFGAFLIAQNAILLAFHFSKWEQHLERTLQNNGFPTFDYISALTVAMIMLIPQIILLMPLYTCLVGGDMVAKEAEDGTLRMILSRPVSRVRLLLVKWCAGAIFSAALVLALGAMAILFARLWFPWGGLAVILRPPEAGLHVFPAIVGLKLFATAHLIMAINATTMMTLSFSFGCFNMKPAAATILALSFLLLNLVLEDLPFFEDYHLYNLVHHFRAWISLFGEPIDWSRIAGSLCLLVGFNVTCLTIGVTGFYR